MGVPRTKRTARPEKRLHDVLSRVRQGDPTVLVEREHGLVRLRLHNTSFTIPDTKFDEFMNPARGVNIHINIRTPVDWGERLRDQ